MAAVVGMTRAVDLAGKARYAGWHWLLGVVSRERLSLHCDLLRRASPLLAAVEARDGRHR